MIGNSNSKNIYLVYVFSRIFFQNLHRQTNHTFRFSLFFRKMDSPIEILESSEKFQCDDDELKKLETKIGDTFNTFIRRVYKYERIKRPDQTVFDPKRIESICMSFYARKQRYIKLGLERRKKLSSLLEQWDPSLEHAMKYKSVIDSKSTDFAIYNGKISKRTKKNVPEWLEKFHDDVLEMKKHYNKEKDEYFSCKNLEIFTFFCLPAVDDE